jgi:opacity protein-like surface antigen
MRSAPPVTRHAARAATAVLFALALFGAAGARAQVGMYAERGIYASVMLTGSEWDGPKPTADTDLGLFTGLGLAAAVGYRWLPLRLELEYQSNTAYKFYGGSADERFAVRSLMVNGIIEQQVNQWLGLFLGAGFGRADIDVDLQTCLQPGGCPTFAPAHTSGSASARQTQFGVTVGPFGGQQVVIGFRRLKSSALGLTDTAGQPFAVDRADLKMSFVGWRGNF